MGSVERMCEGKLRKEVVTKRHRERGAPRGGRERRS